MAGRRLEELLARIAVATERMAADNEITIESGLPICPHCGKLDPVVTMAEQEAGRGPLSSIGIEATCTHCGQVMWVVIDSYSIHGARDEALKEMKERAEEFNHERENLRSNDGEPSSQA